MIQYDWTIHSHNHLTPKMYNIRSCVLMLLFEEDTALLHHRQKRNPKNFKPFETPKNDAFNPKPRIYSAKGVKDEREGIVGKHEPNPPPPSAPAWDRLLSVLRDHVVNGRAVLPAAASLDLMAAQFFPGTNNPPPRSRKPFEFVSANEKIRTCLTSESDDFYFE